MRTHRASTVKRGQEFCYTSSNELSGISLSTLRSPKMIRQLKKKRKRKKERQRRGDRDRVTETERDYTGSKLLRKLLMAIWEDKRSVTNVISSLQSPLSALIQSAWKSRFKISP